jgi:hypothetical protein
MQSSTKAILALLTVTGTGMLFRPMVQASTLKVGTKLVKADGSRDAIVSVTQKSEFGKAYNLAPKATDRVSNILIAQGFLVGSSRYLNDDADYMNRVILGRSIPKSVIPQ